MEHASTFEIGALLGETRALIVRNWWRVLLALIVMTSVGVLMDLKGDARSANLLFSIVGLGFQVWLTGALLSQFGKTDSTSRGSGTVIGVILVSQIGILLGLLLLLIPGVIAFVRWSLAVPIVLSERNGTASALKESWDRTEGHFCSILGLFALIYAPIFLIVVAVGVLMPQTMVVATSVLVNATVSVVLVFGWHAALALFLASEPASPDLEEVFA